MDRSVERQALEAGLKDQQRKLKRCERERDKSRAEIARLEGTKTPERLLEAVGKNERSQGNALGLINHALAIEREHLRDCERAMELATSEVATAEGALRRCDDLALAARLEQLDARRQAAAELVDERTVELFAAHEAHRVVLGEIAEADRTLARDVMSRHVRRGPARSGACFHGLSRFVPTDHYTGAVPFAAAAVAPEIARQRKTLREPLVRSIATVSMYHVPPCTKGDDTSTHDDANCAIIRTGARHGTHKPTSQGPDHAAHTAWLRHQPALDRAADGCQRRNRVGLGPRRPRAVTRAAPRTARDRSGSPAP